MESYDINTKEVKVLVRLQKSSKYMLHDIIHIIFYRCRAILKCRRVIFHGLHDVFLVVHLSSGYPIVQHTLSFAK